MCLAVPAQITAVDEDGRGATATVSGVERKIDVAMTPNVVAGDWVITHSGFALRQIDEAAAFETLDLLSQIETASGDALRL